MGNENFKPTEKVKPFYFNDNNINDNKNYLYNSNISQNLKNPKNIMNFLIRAEANILLSNLNKTTSLTFNNLNLLHDKKIKNNLIENQIKYIQITDDFIDKKTKGKLNFSYNGTEYSYIQTINGMFQTQKNIQNNLIYHSPNNNLKKNFIITRKNTNFNTNNKINSNINRQNQAINKDYNKKEELNLSSFSITIGGNKKSDNNSNNSSKNSNICNNDFANKLIKPVKTFKIGKKEDFIIPSNNRGSGSLNSQEIIYFSDSRRRESPNSIATFNTGSTNNYENSTYKSTLPSDRVIKINNNDVIIRNRKDNGGKICSPKNINYKNSLFPIDNNSSREKSPKNNERNKNKLLYKKEANENFNNFSNIIIAKAIEDDIKNKKIQNFNPNTKKIKKINLKNCKDILVKRALSPDINKLNVDKTFIMSRNLKEKPFSDDEENNTFQNSKLNHSNLDIIPKFKIKKDLKLNNNDNPYIKKIKIKKKNIIGINPYSINNKKLIIQNKNDKCKTVENESYSKKRVFSNIHKSLTSIKTKPIINKNLLVKKLSNNNSKEKIKNINKIKYKKINIDLDFDIENNDNISIEKIINIDRKNRSQNPSMDGKNNERFEKKAKKDKIIINRNEENLSTKNKTNDIEKDETKAYLIPKEKNLKNIDKNINTKNDILNIKIDNNHLYNKIKNNNIINNKISNNKNNIIQNNNIKNNNINKLYKDNFNKDYIKKDNYNKDNLNINNINEINNNNIINNININNNINNRINKNINAKNIIKNYKINNNIDNNFNTNNKIENNNEKKINKKKKKKPKKKMIFNLDLTEESEGKNTFINDLNNNNNKSENISDKSLTEDCKPQIKTMDINNIEDSPLDVFNENNTNNKDNNKNIYYCSFGPKNFKENNFNSNNLDNKTNKLFNYDNNTLGQNIYENKNEYDNKNNFYKNEDDKMKLSPESKLIKELKEKMIEISKKKENKKNYNIINEEIYLKNDDKNNNSNKNYKSNDLERILQEHKINQNKKPIEKPNSNLYQIFNKLENNKEDENNTDEIMNVMKVNSDKINKNISINGEQSEEGFNNNNILDNYNDLKKDVNPFFIKNFSFKKHDTGYFGEKENNKNSSYSKNDLGFQSFGKKEINNLNQSIENKNINYNKYEYDSSNKDKDNFLKFSFKINSELPDSEFNDINYLD